MPLPRQIVNPLPGDKWSVDGGEGYQVRRAVDIRATSLGMGAVARRMMEWRVARRNHFSSRPSIIIGGVSGREVGRQSLKCEWLYPDERTKRVHASCTKGFSLGKFGCHEYK